MDESLGFIILRHITNETTSRYWKLSYDCIRRHYPENAIIIIDDNSNYDYHNESSESGLYKTTIIKSEYPGKGELLPYYYYLKNRQFETACIIHDSVFINQYIDLSVEDYKILWPIEHWYDLDSDIIRMINVFEDEELLQFYKNKHLWKGCFGSMSVIKYDYLKLLNDKYDLSKLFDLIQHRENRSSFERVIGCLLQSNHTNHFLFSDIHNYGMPINTKFEHCNCYLHLPMTKIWTAR
jgi:hypothetical protein